MGEMKLYNIQPASKLIDNGQNFEFLNSQKLRYGTT